MRNVCFITVGWHAEMVRVGEEEEEEVEDAVSGESCSSLCVELRCRYFGMTLGKHCAEVFVCRRLKPGLIC